MLTGRGLACTVASAMLVLSAPVAVGEDGDGAVRRLRIEVPLERPAEQLAELRSLDLDVNTYDRKAGAAYLIVSEPELGELERLGYAWVVVEDVTPSPSTIAALGDYHDEQESDAAVSRVAGDYPAIALRMEYAEPTEEGRIVPLLKISDNVAIDEPEPRILFVSQHHAREVMTPEVMVDMMDFLTQNYGIDPEVTEWVDGYEIYIVPCHNPDGTHHVFNVNTNWRKNRRDNGDGSFGVDPNRNYDYTWGPEGCNGSSGSTGSDTYRGPSPASEPETRGLNDVARDVDPSISLTYHTYGELVLHPFGCSPNLPDDPDRRAHRDVGSTLAAVIENDNGSGWYELGTAPETLYEVDGDSDGWLHAVAGTVAFTIEMNTALQGFQPDYDTWRDDTVLRNREGWRYLLRRLSGGAATGRVRNACTDEGVVAEVGVVEQTFTQAQEARTSLPGHGFFHRILVTGDYTWYADADGFHRQEWPISVGHDAVRRDLWLVPDGSHGIEARSLSVDDAAGDADGQLDPGETADLWLTALASGEAVGGVTATLTTDDVYLEILDGSSALPDIAADSEAGALDPMRVRVLEDAPDGHVAEVTVTFTANEALCRGSSSEELRVTRGFPSCPFEEQPLDEDPGWTITGPAGGWEFGPPEGSGGTGGPFVAHTGTNVYGTNLDGNYGSTGGEFVLTSTPFDLQGLRDAELVFWRWLNNEPAYDLARIEVSVDGQEWTEVWRGFGRDTRWERYRVELPDGVDDEPQVWVRFVLLQDGGGSRSGFYVDDVGFCGESALTAGGKIKFESYRISEDDPDYGNADGEVDADETVTMAVTVRSSRNAEAREVSAVLTSGDPGVTIHNGVALYPDLEAGGVAESLPPHFSFSVGEDCARDIPFVLETRYEDGLSTLSHFSVPVGSLAPATLFADDMETDPGWTVSGNATQGAWERGEPAGNTHEDEPTNPDEDHTADPAFACWATQNVPPPAVVSPFEAEVDGTTILTSPVLAAGGFETLELRYWRWFYRGAGSGPDTFRVEATTDGVNYRSVSEFGAKANEWTEVVLELSEFLEPTDDLRLRFVVTDAGGESIVEGGLDDLDLSGDRWVCDPFDPPLLDPPNPVGDTLRVDRLGRDVRLDWEEPPTDPGHGRATFYRVDRSEQAGSGFAGIANPTAPQHVDVGAAGESRPDLYFYLVTAENSGGGE